MPISSASPEEMANSKYNDIKVIDQYKVNIMSVWNTVIKGQNISCLYLMKMIQKLPKEEIKRQKV